MAYVCLLVPLLLLVVLLALGRYEDHVLHASSPSARGRSQLPALPSTGWPDLSALEGAAGAAVVPSGTE